MRGVGMQPVNPCLRVQTRMWPQHRTGNANAPADLCPTLDSNHVTPHTLGHTAAVRLLHAGVETSVIATWRWHEPVETTPGSLHADLAINARALARKHPNDQHGGRRRGFH
jgi:integrase/recombinase XerD